MSQQEQAISAKKIPESKKERSIDFSLPIWKTMIPFLIPLIFSNALQSLGGTVSSVLIGKQLGRKCSGSRQHGISADLLFDLLCDWPGKCQLRAHRASFRKQEHGENERNCRHFAHF